MMIRRDSDSDGWGFSDGSTWLQRPLPVQVPLKTWAEETLNILAVVAFEACGSCTKLVSTT
jgi:hypothetical protein